MGLCRSDPTENDSVEGLRPNARGPGLVTFGVCLDFIQWILFNSGHASKFLLFKWEADLFFLFYAA